MGRAGAGGGEVLARVAGKIALQKQARAPARGAAFASSPGAPSQLTGRCAALALGTGAPSTHPGEAPGSLWTVRVSPSLDLGQWGREGGRKVRGRAS